MSKISVSRVNAVMLAGVVACFILSGFAALLYQTAWMRQFSLVFGTSELAVAAVLSAYMGGLAFGASLASRFVHRISRPVLFYGVLEAGIAISALAVPWMLKLARLLYVAMLGNQPEPVDASGLGQSFFYLLVAFLVLAIPTTFMGATLPLLTKYVVQAKDQIGSRVGLLYATNTIGAIGGTVVAGFILLPMFGLNATVWFGVVINVVVFGLAALIAIAAGRPTNQAAPPTDSVVSSPAVDEDDMAGRRRWILPIMLLSGANSFVYEVLWTRLLGHILGGSITAFATMLAGFLGGIAIGSAIAALFAKTRSGAVSWFVFVQCGIAATSILVYHLLPLAIPEHGGLAGNVGTAISVLLPATIFIGATFPLAVRILATDEISAAPASASVYSWNTVGAIIGATAAAFFLIPALKYEGAVKFAVVLNLMLALGAAGLLAPKRWIGRGVTAVLIVAAAIAYRPAMPEAILRASPVYPEPNGDIRFYEVGRSATVIVVENNGFLNLRTNGLPEASTSLKGAPPSQHNQMMLSIMPVLARPDTESMLVVGLGAGVALEGVPMSVKRIDAVELEPQVVEANRSLAAERENDPLSDPRTHIIINDARSALSLTSRKYDSIISQPSHPWTAGASHLYTREYMQLAKDHLNEGGVYLQWMNTQFVDEFLLKSLCATMLDVFPYVQVYQWQSEVLFFVGSDAPLNIAAEMAKTGRPISDDPLGYAEKGVGSVEDVIAALTMDQTNVELFAQDGKVISDNYNYMATRSARAMENGTVLRSNRLADVLQPYDPLLQGDSAVRQRFPGTINYPYVSRRLQGMRMPRRAISLANSLSEAGDPQGRVMIGLGQEGQGERIESQRNIILALQANPEDEQARFALLQPWLADVSQGKQIPEYVATELGKFSGTAAATFQASLAAGRDDMYGLVGLDAVLGDVRPSDLWYEMSVKLRAEWRIRLTNPEYQPRMANEATQLIDSAISFFQDVDFYVLRVRSTVVAGDMLSSVETGTRMVYIMDAELNRADSQGIIFDRSIRELRLSQLVIVRQALAGADSSEAVPQYKYDQLMASLDRLEARLNTEE